MIKHFHMPLNNLLVNQHNINSPLCRIPLTPLLPNKLKVVITQRNQSTFNRYNKQTNNSYYIKQHMPFSLLDDVAKCNPIFLQFSSLSLKANNNNYKRKRVFTQNRFLILFLVLMKKEEVFLTNDTNVMYY